MMENRICGKACRRSTGAVTRLLLVVLLTVSLGAGGCATMTTGSGSEPAGGDNTGKRLPFPASRKTMQPEVVPAGKVPPPLVVSFPEYHDPLIGFNRAIFAFNDVAYRYLLIPLSKGYLQVVPEGVRHSVDNFFYNIKTPIYAVNHLLQLKPKPLGRNLLRFGINTTVGLLGLFDPAKEWWGLEREETHFEDTLIRYGSGYGVYLVLPIFGPSDLRNGASLVVDYFLDPVTIYTENPEQTGIRSVDYLQDYAPDADRYETIREKAKDPYIFFRNLYLQGVQRDVRY